MTGGRYNFICDHFPHTMEYFYYATDIILDTSYLVIVIEPAVKYQQSYTIDDIEDKIRHGFFHLWPGKNSAMITELVNLPQERVYNLLFAGGKYDEIEGIIEQIEIFARAIGCSKLMGGGRPGWHRKIKHLGFKRDFILTKTL